MRGLIAYVAAVAAVCWLIPWPELWPASVAMFAVAYVLAPEPDPRNTGGKRSRERTG